MLKTVENFMNSSDADLTEEHVPSFWTDVSRQDDVPIRPQERNWIWENAILIWQAMNDKEETKIRMPHDGYLKAYQVTTKTVFYL